MTEPSLDTFSDELISVITYRSAPIDEPTRTSKGMLDDAIRGRGEEVSKAIGKVSISAKKLEDQMTHLLKSMGNVLSNAKARAGDLAGMELDEVELSVEISGEGEVNLMGIGGIQAGASGAITLKFVRKS